MRQSLHSRLDVFIYVISIVKMSTYEAGATPGVQLYYVFTHCTVYPWP